MKVYVILQQWQYDNTEIIAIYNDKIDAESHAATANVNSSVMGPRFVVEEHTIREWEGGR